MSLTPKNIQIKKVPETTDEETWTIFNERLNDLANQGYRVSFTTETYIILTRKTPASRREE